jgi:hypothetical protein
LKIRGSLWGWGAVGLGLPLPKLFYKKNLNGRRALQLRKHLPLVEMLSNTKKKKSWSAQGWKEQNLWKKQNLIS